MPTYDYRCKSCDHEWELFQSITANPVRKCPSCGKRSAMRVIGPGAGILFKGSGFYQTDYRSESYKKGAEAEKKAREGSTDNGKSKGASKSEGQESSKSSAGGKTSSADKSSKPSSNSSD